MNLAKMYMRAVSALFEKRKKSIHTNIVCQVVSYDEALNTCSVQPVVRAMRADDVNNMVPYDLPQVDDVPVKQMGSGKLLLSVAPAVGSYGNLIVSECSIEAWINDGGIVNPTSARSHHFSDGIFDPGVYPNKVDGDNGKIESAIKTDRVSLRTRSGLTEISVLDDETIFIKSDSAVVVEADMEVDGGVDAGSDVVATGLGGTVSLYSHVHASPGAPPTPVPIPPTP